MKRLFTPVFIFVSLFLLGACASNEEIADELIEYYNNEWIPIHVTKVREVDTTKNSVLNITTKLEEKHAEEVIAVLEEDVIPVADNVIDRYESIQLKQRDVKKLNKKQIKAEKNGRDLLRSIIDYSNGDISNSEYRKNENDLKREFNEINDYLEKLMEKYNLEYDKEKESIEGFYELKRKED